MAGSGDQSADEIEITPEMVLAVEIALLSIWPSSLAQAAEVAARAAATFLAQDRSSKDHSGQT